jgi:chromosome segregation ATPase
VKNEFTPEELKEVIRAARVFNPGFSEEQLQSLVELQRHAADSTYLETVKGLQRLEKEAGVPMSQALEMHGRLLRENKEMEQKLAAQNTKLEALNGHLRAMEEKHQEVLKAIQDTTTQLDELRRELERQEKRLVAFNNKAVREKQRIEKELAEYRHKADITEAEIATAGEVKVEVIRHGFSLEVALGIASEFAAYTDARGRLAEALKKEGKLTSYLTTLETKIKTLEENQRHMESILSRQGNEVEQHEALLSQLKAEIAEKSELVGFYHRYVHLRPFIEYLGSSDYLTFHHCLWCGALFWIIRPGGVATKVYKCPWCALTLVEPDKNAYAAVSQPPGMPLKLLP